MTGPLSADAVRTLSRSCGFALAGLARAEALDPGPLRRWLDAGYDADMVWIRRKVDERLDPTKVLPGARTVLALGIPYHHVGASPVARYARGRDYHYAHKDRMKTLRKRLVELAPGIETYACVDNGAAMEKVWAERAGLGWIGKNGCLINPTWGSWITLSVMFLDREVDAFDQPHGNLCGNCDTCLHSCPTDAFPSPGVVDARRCLSYQTIENHGAVPEELRPKLAGHVFGCDVCQEVCPFNRRPIDPGDARFEPRPIGTMSADELAGLSEDDFEALAAGTALVRARYDGIRRNAVLALGAARRRAARPLLERLSRDDSDLVREAALWALARIR